MSLQRLAELNAHLEASAAARSGGDPRVLPNARAFHAAWRTHATLDGVDQALASVPANAGPLNAGALVARSLAALGELSPAYLQQFLSQVETLQWLQDAKPVKPKRAAPRSRKR
jgi:hypothetical protein